eukprot:199900-Chlamydomonas_euryale.AAC.1
MPGMPWTPRHHAPAGAHGQVLQDSCLLKQAMDHEPQQHQQTIVVEKSDLRRKVLDTSGFNPLGLAWACAHSVWWGFQDPSTVHALSLNRQHLKNAPDRGLEGNVGSDTLPRPPPAPLARRVLPNTQGDATRTRWARKGIRRRQQGCK